MRAPDHLNPRFAVLNGVRDAIPLLGAYFPVAMSFGLIALQSGLNITETMLISTLIYAGASQFLFVSMYASGAPLILVVLMTVLINGRHLIYGPSIAPWLGTDRRWFWLMHGLTDQIFALAHTRLPQLHEDQRMGWYTGAMLLAWFSWIFGTAVGAVVGQQLTERWPLVGEILPFALPALFLVLLAPRFATRLWSIVLGSTIALAIGISLIGMSNAAIPMAAALGTTLYFILNANTKLTG